MISVQTTCRPNYQICGIICSRFISHINFQPSLHIRNIFPKSINWYPGHIQKGLKAICNKLATVDVIIELHDSRIPLTGRCQFVNEASQIRPRILIMNKCDLAEPINNLNEYKRFLSSNSIFSPYQQPPEDIFFTNMKSPELQHRLLRQILASLVRIAPSVNSSSLPTHGGEFTAVEDELRGKDADISLTSVTAMVVGLPNCGKSTLINALRSFSQGGRRKAASVGKCAGRTRSVGAPVIIKHNFPIPSGGDGGLVRECTIRMVDTPGILEPKAQNLCGQLSLGVCGAVDWNVVDHELLCDYLLFCLNRREKWGYVRHFGLPGPTGNVKELLAWVSARCDMLLEPLSQRLVAESGGLVSSAPRPNFHLAAFHFLRVFSEGKLGRLTLLPGRDEEAAAPYFILSNPSKHNLQPR